nr:ABC transporter substrate-binding protein [uncultured Methanospirillum sp.]
MNFDIYFGVNHMEKKLLISRTIVGIYTILLLMCVITVCVAQDSNSGPNTKSITDMAGRTLTVPNQITNVLSTYPPTTEMIYMLAPEKLMGWQTDEKNMTYMPEKYRTLPVVGGWYGGLTADYETFISMKPDAIFTGFTKNGNYLETINERQEKFGSIPYIAVEDTTNVNNFAPAIKYMGELLGEEQKAVELTSYYDNVYNKVSGIAASIPESEKKSVYYAEGPEGLTTDPKGSMHAQLIDLCGGINVYEGAQKGEMGLSPVSMEQVLEWNPDVIIAGSKGFYDKVYSDPNWQKIKAVQDKQVYCVPTNPFGWFDRPPCLNVIIGIPWTAKVLYPDKFADIDLKSLTKEYYQKFIHTDLTDNQVSTILSESGLTDY